MPLEINRVFSKEANMTLAVIMCVSLIATFISLSMLSRLAPVMGLLDHPNSRKVHVHQTPLIGGLSIAIGVMLGLFFIAPFQDKQLQFILMGTGIMVITGALDDARDLSVYKRLTIQILSAMLVMLGSDLKLDSLGTYFGYEVQTGFMAYPLTVFSIVAGVNAFNLIDGLDGLAGSLALVPISILCGLGIYHGQTELVNLTAVLIVCIVAFLSKNMRLPWQERAKVFLGDAGSTGIGFLVACLLIKSSQGESRVIEPVTALWLIAIPLIDTLTVMIGRIRRKESAFKASKDHIHHILLSYIPVNKVVTIISGTGLCLSLVGIIITENKYESFSMILFVFLLIVNLFMKRKQLVNNTSMN
ncbi:MAG TPA: undecaprenyl-phosphate alpha-N-acetylglucosaminyl 1-phosphate transferase [Gammaproteobacteria bacterium]|nr:undecaprenyl-phosphate alpha-N-acetylglucosaminyl 1-phosphate transferase [Gammaproteobacteria bacterium]HBF08092.1 undecaprenyl-phosphate alpha-N-acetylglucosaminyl 1-phosphate transferase [Gammaproteobacteria bacterium]HCK91723.1 undecaprenyl-phosphate alpha-N-acetylglucosaminyl 1-phosphate transferase [Gammaproteobacteria bacterium]|tara:strand:- start:788 stop:1864 length:1077 start_codon:yes stop_codon:yes gene_type:complete